MRGVGVRVPCGKSKHRQRRLQQEEEGQEVPAVGKPRVFQAVGPSVVLPRRNEGAVLRPLLGRGRGGPGPAKATRAEPRAPAAPWGRLQGSAPGTSRSAGPGAAVQGPQAVHRVLPGSRSPLRSRCLWEVPEVCVVGFRKFEMPLSRLRNARPLAAGVWDRLLGDHECAMWAGLAPQKGEPPDGAGGCARAQSGRLRPSGRRDPLERVTGLGGDGRGCGLCPRHPCCRASQALSPGVCSKGAGTRPLGLCVGRRAGAWAIGRREAPPCSPPTFVLLQFTSCSPRPVIASVHTAALEETGDPRPRWGRSKVTRQVKRGLAPRTPASSDLSTRLSP
ncbi:uncharacterized protein LOC123804389 [Phyllostomus hastatus]|uniref:uncharacterized protein LOC123804389 n=1 Tax=Phyllostomus hastatus TaxID=9423 RepID=UPI001E67FDE6|nr:uncharacterized protein LOC123804389 [Phyllostomus hastatus]